MRLAHWLVLFAAIPLACGCTDFDQPSVKTTPPPVVIDKTPVAEETTPVEPVAPVDEPVAEPDPTIGPVPPEEPAVPDEATEPDANNAPAEEPTERVAAEAGVGVQGQSLTPGSAISRPAQTFFNTKQRLVFNQVEQALQLYKASTDSMPQSTEEFMEKVIQPNGIELPKLPRGHTYVFDPESGQLLVEKPKN